MLRLRLLRQSVRGASGDRTNERISDRVETIESSTEENDVMEFVDDFVFAFLYFK